jgi:hypothetical protein
VVIDVVTPQRPGPLHQALLLALADRFPPAVDLKLGEDAFRVGAQGVNRDKELAGRIPVCSKDELSNVLVDRDGGTALAGAVPVQAVSADVNQLTQCWRGRCIRHLAHGL